MSERPVRGGDRYTYLKDADEARAMMQTVYDNGLEGLMLKNVAGKYSPKGRHWLKVMMTWNGFWLDFLTFFDF